MASRAERIVSQVTAYPDANDVMETHRLLLLSEKMVLQLMALPQRTFVEGLLRSWFWMTRSHDLEMCMKERKEKGLCQFLLNQSPTWECSFFLRQHLHLRHGVEEPSSSWKGEQFHLILAFWCRAQQLCSDGEEKLVRNFYRMSWSAQSGFVNQVLKNTKPLPPLQPLTTDASARILLYSLMLAATPATKS